MLVSKLHLNFQNYFTSKFIEWALAAPSSDTLIWNAVKWSKVVGQVLHIFKLNQSKIRPRAYSLLWRHGMTLTTSRGTFLWRHGMTLMTSRDSHLWRHGIHIYDVTEWPLRRHGMTLTMSRDTNLWRHWVSFVTSLSELRDITVITFMTSKITFVT